VGFGVELEIMPVELSARAIAALPLRKAPYWVAPNLYIVKDQEPGSWSLMYASPLKGRRVAMGLGSARDIPLRQVKAEVLEYRGMVARGRCPLSERQAEQRTRKAGMPVVGRTFKAVAEAYIHAHAAGWANRKHEQQWTNTLATYAYPALGHLPVNRIDVGEVMDVLEPIWRTVPATASRVRGRIESVLDYAKARKWFPADRENPARWRGGIGELLPPHRKLKPVRHQPAVPWRELPELYRRLAEDGSIRALALRYAILTALRTKEVRLTAAGEIDGDQTVHVVPAEHTKPRRVQRVPLSSEALAVLEQVEALRTGPLLFEGAHVGKPIGTNALAMKLHELQKDVTVHGFRSSFRDWCSENGVGRELAERALGHVVGDKVEAAYLRTDALEARRPVMQAWADFVSGRVAEERLRLAG
jgi:integrase